ncbi:MAG: hypothetical protein JSU85_14065 [Candidatus Zixiibacteriota bacterium]|nr:MAG: hypothetical protein JSU85_14065 [candidate division Zixibacteria bacterium]
MKSLMIATIILILSFPAYGQEETLISGRIESGGYGGVEVKFGNINGEWEVLVGGRGGWIINHEFVLGGAGYGLATRGETNPGSIIPYLNEQFEMGYGGVLLAYIINSHKLIHLNIETLIGGGGISHYYGRDDGIFDTDFDDDAFFIIEPGVNFELNITKRLRFATGASYRITSGVEYLDLEDSDITGPAINLMLKFGKF